MIPANHKLAMTEEVLFMDILYVDASVRKQSRTAELANFLMEKLDGKVTALKLCEQKIPVLDEAFLEKRDKACAASDFSDEMFDMANKFAAADTVVIAAPYYDLSFPAALKQFFEQINVIGLTFAYGEDGRPYGLCKAKKLFYVTTAGGFIFSDEYGFGYVKALAETFYGIPETFCFKAEGLDIYGADTEAIMSRAKADIAAYFG